jgi:hypothetical protein
MSDLPNTAENNEQILNDIQTLQQMEKQLFNNLENNTNLNSQQKQQIIEKMNQLSNMRINLYKTLSGVNVFFQNALSTSVGTLKEQSIAVTIVESELNKAKKRLEVLENERNNKIRLVEINEYYGDKYAEHSQLMKIIIFTLVPIIIFAILNNKGILPTTPYTIIISIIALIGSIFFWRKFSSIIMRDNMNYQEYNWPFNPDTAPEDTSTTISDPWLSLTPLGSCIGENCCSDDQTYDSSLNQCINSSHINESTVSESFVTESMVNSVLTKQQPNKYKNDVSLLSQYEAPLSNSFINKSSIK